MKNKLKYISIIMLSFFMLLTVKSNAVLKMEIKPGTTAWTSMTASESYDYCYNLRNSNTTLGESQLDPHLTLNKDWGAVAYLAVSPYGKLNSRFSYTTVLINGKSYNTTTENATGVIQNTKNMITASLYGGIGNRYTKSLTDNLDSKYVETLNVENTIENTRGQALAETKGWFGSTANYPKSSHPICVRYCFLDYSSVFSDGSGPYGDGNAYSKVTFRPVIWNIK